MRTLTIGARDVAFSGMLTERTFQVVLVSSAKPVGFSFNPVPDRVVRYAGAPLDTIEFDITNTGTREGAEVAQRYVRDVQSSLPRPQKELKGFRKIVLAPGARQTVSIPPG